MNNSAQTNGTPVIQLRDLSKTYQSGEVEVKAVRGVTLEIAHGDFVAVMGASGSGKSTLMNMIGALDRPTDGHYWLDGIDISTLDRDALAELYDNLSRLTSRTDGLGRKEQFGYDA